MNYEGPLPDEALPVGEEPLHPEELSRIANFMLTMHENASRFFPGLTTEADVTPEEWAIISSQIQKSQARAFESLKQEMINHREDAD